MGITLEEMARLDDEGWEVVRLLMIRPDDESAADPLLFRPLLDVLLRHGGTGQASLDRG